MAARKSWCPDRRDTIWIDCNPQAGREMKEVHPLVVLSPREFNQRTGIVIGLPMTTASYNEANPGTDLTGSTSVTFDGTPAQFAVNSTGTAISATVPTGATTGTVKVATPSGTLNSNVQYRVTT